MNSIKFIRTIAAASLIGLLHLVPTIWMYQKNFLRIWIRKKYSLLLNI